MVDRLEQTYDIKLTWCLDWIYERWAVDEALAVFPRMHRAQDESPVLQKPNKRCAVILVISFTSGKMFQIFGKLQKDLNPFVY